MLTDLKVSSFYFADQNLLKNGDLMALKLKVFEMQK